MKGLKLSQENSVQELTKTLKRSNIKIAICISLLSSSVFSFIATVFHGVSIVHVPAWVLVVGIWVIPLVATLIAAVELFPAVVPNTESEVVTTDKERNSGTEET